MTARTCGTSRKQILKPAENLAEGVSGGTRRQSPKPTDFLAEPRRKVRNVCPPYPYSASAPLWGGRGARGDRDEATASTFAPGHSSGLRPVFPAVDPFNPHHRSEALMRAEIDDLGVLA